jgi:mRNA-degrading endonuclease toxin of MazEF toxin-antitoxin module
MRDMTPCNQGDVVKVLFPFTNTTMTKERPAIIISPFNFNRRSNDIVILGVTSNPKYLGNRERADEFHIKGTEQTAAGLPFVSCVKLGKIATVEKTQIRTVIGALPPATTARLVNKFKSLF